ncbi:hypothetical protein NHQ30_011173 [Ciborinia camelliae]|nr:hypothetical protein NHQ30_011173 [Ciborinia camelliae]
MCRKTLLLYVCKHEGTQDFKCQELLDKEEKAQATLRLGDCELGFQQFAGAYPHSRATFCPECRTNPRNRPRRTSQQIKQDAEKRAEVKEELKLVLKNAELTAPNTLLQGHLLSWAKFQLAHYEEFDKFVMAGEEWTKECHGLPDEEEKLFAGMEKLNDDFDKATASIWKQLEHQNQGIIDALEKSGEKWNYFINFFREDEYPFR